MKHNNKLIITLFLVSFIVIGLLNSGLVHATNNYWVWGDNSFGQFGNNTTTDSNVPINVTITQNIKSFKNSPINNRFVNFWDTSNNAWSIGNNFYGQLGNNSTTNSSVPVQVSGLTDIIQTTGSSGAGYAIKSNGTVWAWGNNSNGQLGNNSTTNSSVPVQVSGLTGVTQITGGFSSGYALKSDGNVWAWGKNNYGQLGNNSTTDSHVPVQVSGLTDVIQISGGNNSGYALKSDGSVWAWGYNSHGQLGNDSTTESHVPVQVSGLIDVTQISGGSESGYALKSDGSVWAWGYNSHGQLGNDSTTESHVPVQVSGLIDVTQISGGYNSGYALKSDGSIWAWGNNSNGQLGNDSTTDSHIPVQVQGLTGITKVIATNTTAFAIILSPENYLTNPTPTPLYTNQSYDWNLGYQDSDYNSDITYDYNFGFDNDDNYDNSILSTRLTNQTLNVADINLDYYNITYTPTTDDINTGLYNWIKINKYINGIYDLNITLYTSDTKDVVYNLDANLTNPSPPVYIYKDYNFDMNVQDFVYDSNKTYKYDFGINTTPSLTGAEELQSLQSFTLDSNTQTTVPITYDFNQDYINNDYYSYVTIYQYDNGSLLDSNTYWSSDTFTPVYNLDANLFAPNYTDFANRLYPTRLYDWNGVIQDLSYNPNRTYTYTLGVNDTNSLDGNETVLTTGTSLNIADTNVTTYYLSGVIPSYYADMNIYSYITVKTYDSNNLLETKTYWTADTSYVNWGLLKLATFDEISNTHLDDNVKIYDSTNDIYFTADVNGVIQENINSDGINGYNDANIYRIVAGTSTHPNRQLDMLLSKTASVDENVYLLDDQNGSSITYKVNNIDDTLWANKFLMFRKSTGDYVDVESNDLIPNYSTSTTTNNQRGVRIQPLDDLYLESVDFKQNISSPFDRFEVYDENLNVLIYESSVLSTVTNIGVPYYQKLLLQKDHIYRIIFDANNLNYTSYKYNNYLTSDINTDNLLYLSGYDDGTSNNAYQILNINTVNQAKMDIVENDPLILVAKTDAAGEFTGYVLPDGNYVAYLYDEYGVLQHTYNKVTVTVKKPLDELDVSEISPYDVSVGGLLNYSLTNKTDANVTYNIFGGTEEYYDTQVVDTDKNYIPRNYLINVPLGSSFTTNYEIQPYLLKIADGVTPTIYVYDKLKRSIEGVVVKIYKSVNGSVVLVQSSETTSMGRTSFAAYPFDTYTIKLYYQGTLTGTYTVQPRSSSDNYYFVIDTIITEEQEPVINNIYDWSSTPDTVDITTTDPEVNINISIIGLNTTPALMDYNLVSYQDNTAIETKTGTLTGTSADINAVFDKSKYDSSIPSIKFVLTYHYTVGSEIRTFTSVYSMTITGQSNRVFVLLQDLPNSIGRIWAMILAILITISLLAFITFTGFVTDTRAITIIGVFILGVFLFLGWLNIGVTVMGTDVVVFAYVLVAIFSVLTMIKGGNQ